MQITYFGANTLVLNKAESTLMIDPYFSRLNLLKFFTKISPDKVRIAAGLKVAKIVNVDAVLLTHTHYDHALDAPEVLRQTGGVLYGSESAANLARGAGMLQENFQTVTGRGYYKVGDFKVGFHPSRHIALPALLGWLLPEGGVIAHPLSPPGRVWGYQSGKVFAIQVDQLLVFGSASCKSGAYQDLDVNTVVMGIGGLETKPRAYLEKLYQDTVLATGAERVLLSHWDNFLLPADKSLVKLGFAELTIQRISNLGNKYGQIVRALPYNQPITL